MDAKLKADWIAALRSGDYKQGVGRLYGDGRYCCLGVLCRVADLKINAARDSVGDREVYSALNDFGLTPGFRAALTARNDGGDSFPRIADYIEANIPAEG